MYALFLLNHSFHLLIQLKTFLFPILILMNYLLCNEIIVDIYWALLKTSWLAIPAEHFEKTQMIHLDKQVMPPFHPHPASSLSQTPDFLLLHPEI